MRSLPTLLKLRALSLSLSLLSSRIVTEFFYLEIAVDLSKSSLSFMIANLLMIANYKMSFLV